MNYKNILADIKDKVATVTINRPEKMNALNNELLSELENFFGEVQDNDDVFVIIITGAGEKAFVAGADISELNKLGILSAKEFSVRGQKIFNMIENSAKPVIAAVNGFALGGGCELALACHIRLASNNAKFGQPEVNLGIIPGYGGTQRLARLVNTGRAAEYILSGNMIDASEAFRIGLVNHIYEKDELPAKAFELAVTIASKGQQAVRLALDAVRISQQSSLRQGLDYEAAVFAICCGTEDFKEGTSAFLEKRKPDFKHR
ncbi:MAG: enoyl-CoA hydratase-related protein [Ignavibacteriaceae bacterium]